MLVWANPSPSDIQKRWRSNALCRWISSSLSRLCCSCFPTSKHINTTKSEELLPNSETPTFWHHMNAALIYISFSPELKWQINAERKYSIQTTTVQVQVQVQRKRKLNILKYMHSGRCSPNACLQLKLIAKGAVWNNVTQLFKITALNN